jgi:hypothetical protein
LPEFISGMVKKIPLQHSEDYFIRTVLKKTPLKTIMSHPPVAIRLDESFSRVVAL